MLGDYGLDPTPDGNDGVNELGDPPRRDVLNRQPLAIGRPVAEIREVPPPPLAQPADFHAHTRCPPDELGQRARGDRTAVVDHAYSVADLLGLLEQVGVEKDRRPGGAELSYYIADIVASERVEGTGRLVQDHQLGLAEEGNAETEALLHPFGEGTHFVIAAVRQAHCFEASANRARELLARQLQELTVQGQHLAADSQLW